MASLKPLLVTILDVVACDPASPDYETRADARVSAAEAVNPEAPASYHNDLNTAKAADPAAVTAPATTTNPPPLPHKDDRGFHKHEKHEKYDAKHKEVVKTVVLSDKDKTPRSAPVPAAARPSGDEAKTLTLARWAADKYVPDSASCQDYVTGVGAGAYPGTGNNPDAVKMYIRSLFDAGCSAVDNADVRKLLQAGGDVVCDKHVERAWNALTGRVHLTTPAGDRAVAAAEAAKAAGFAV